MPSVVHRLPSRIDAENVDDVRNTVAGLIERYHSVTLDCSDLAHISSAGMRVLEGAARTGSITLVHATPVVHLLASVFGVEVSFADEGHEMFEVPVSVHSSSAVTVPQPARHGGSPPDAELVSQLRELATARTQLSESDHTSDGLSQFERARLNRIESQIDIVIDDLRRRRPLRDWLPDAY